MCIYDFEISILLIKAAKDLLYLAFQSDYVEENDELKNISIGFLKANLSEKAQVALEDMFGCSIMKETESTTFIASFVDVFTSRILPPSRFICLVQKFICTKIKEESIEVDRDEMVLELTFS